MDGFGKARFVRGAQHRGDVHVRQASADVKPGRQVLGWQTFKRPLLCRPEWCWPRWWVFFGGRYA